MAFPDITVGGLQPIGMAFDGTNMWVANSNNSSVTKINASTGVDATAQRMMAHAAERRLDRLIIVNRIDAAGADCAAVLAQIQAAFGRECLPLNLPADGGARVVDCFFNRSGSTDFSSACWAS